MHRKRTMILFQILLFFLTLTFSSSVDDLPRNHPDSEISSTSQTTTSTTTRQQPPASLRARVLPSNDETTVNASLWNNETVTNRERELIVEGTQADVGEFPWFVSSTESGYCGGSLVAPSVVLTAAHCSPFTVGGEVFIGATRRSSFFGGAVARTITRFIKHPLYKDDGDDLAYDLALFQLDEPVTTIQPLAWNANPSIPPAGTLVTVMGFGRLYFGDGPVSDILLKVDLRVVSDADCLQLYGRNNLDTNVMLCTIGSPGLQRSGSACQGDSGGPLVMMSGDSPLQVGVVSWGIRCGSNIYPGVYSRPSGVADWMDETICELSEDCDSTPRPTSSPTSMGPTLSPAPSSPIIPTIAPTSELPCVCLSEPQCLQSLCSRVNSEVICEALGCNWGRNTGGGGGGGSGGGGNRPPNIEDPSGDINADDDDDDDNNDGGFQREEEKSDLQKAGYAVIVAVGASVATFCILVGITSICCCYRDRKLAAEQEQQRRNRARNGGAVTPDRQVYAVKPRAGEYGNEDMEIAYVPR